jgi:hypothetical protein
MLSKALLSILACMCLFLFILTPGCGEPKPEAVKVAPEAEEPIVESIEVEAEAPAEPEKPVQPAVSGANLFLTFAPGDVTTYQVKTTDTQEVKWEGTVPKGPNFEDGRNYNKTEITFTQKILDVDANGVATANIKIDKLKFHSIVRNRTTINFDSTKTAAGNLLANLIGKSYTISIAPNGEVVIIDTKKALTGFGGPSRAAKAAQELLNPNVIKRRHALLVLPDADQNPIQLEEQWSGTKTYSFGLMGSNAYERIYTLEDIEEKVDGKVAVVSMEAVPSTEFSEGQTTGQAQGMSQMFDTQETYTGQLRFDLDNGRLEEYSEKLDVQWVAVMPLGNQQKGEPSVLKMSAARSYDLKKID